MRHSPRGVVQSNKYMKKNTHTDVVNCNTLSSGTESMVKNTRKNKTKQSVVWPTKPYFTIKELWSLNPEFVEITLRVRLTNSIENGKVAEVGSVPGENGRPQKVFSLTPVTQITLSKIQADNLNLVDNANKLFNVINVTSSNTLNKQILPVNNVPAVVTSK